MKLNQIAPLALASVLTMTGCKEEQANTTRQQVTSAATTASVHTKPTAKPVVSVKTPVEPKKKVEPKVCQPKNVVLPGVKIVPRNEWAPLPPKPEILGAMENCNNYPIEKVTLHHTGYITEPGEGRKRAGGAVYFHLGKKTKKRGGGKGWGDVAYHYLVTPDGEILEGRNPGFRGDSNADYYPRQERSHTPEHHLLVSLVGNFEDEKQEFTWQARSSVTRLLAASLKHYGLSANDVVFHKDVADTGCPGKQVINWFRHGGKKQLAKQPNLLPK